MAFKQKKIIALEKAAKPLLVYDNGRSHYEFDGCHLDRITKVLSEMDDNEGLMAWRERVGEEVADMIRSLCGPAGRYVTGQTIHVSGGVYMPG